MAQLTMYPAQVNSPELTLTAAINTVVTTIAVTGDVTTKLPTAPNTFVIGTGEDAETIYYPTAATGAGLAWTFTGVTRGWQGVANSWLAGDSVARLFTAYDHDTFRTNILTLDSLKHTYDAIVYQSGLYTTAVDKNGNVLSSVTIASQTDNAPIQAALTYIPATGGIVHICKGTYNIAANITLKTKTVLEGEGKDVTIINSPTAVYYIGAVSVDYTTMKDFKVTGYAKIYHYRANYYKVENVTVTSSATAALLTAVSFAASLGANATGITSTNGEYINCEALDSYAYGFQLHAGDTPNFGTYTNISYINCKATNCLSAAGLNIWIPGFVLEGGTFTNIVYDGCTASGCWESGFHTEVLTNCTSLLYKNCLSYNNGQKTTPDYGSGFLINNLGDTTLIGCNARDNAKNSNCAGFRFGNTAIGTTVNATCIGCVDDSSYYGFLISTLNGVKLKDCTAFSNTGYALAVVKAYNIHVFNFNAINTVYATGSVLLGGRNGWGSGYETYDSYFDIHVTNPSGTYGINCDGLYQSTVKGSVKTSAAAVTRCINIMYESKHLVVRDVDIITVGSTAARGIYISSTALNVNTISIMNCTIRDTATPATMTHGIYNAHVSLFPKITGCQVINALTAETYACGQTTTVAHGRTSIADGGTITHGLGTTPTWAIVTPITAGEFATVTTLGATTLTVAIKKHDNSAGTTQFVSWMCGI